MRWPSRTSLALAAAATVVACTQAPAPPAASSAHIVASAPAHDAGPSPNDSSLDASADAAAVDDPTAAVAREVLFADAPTTDGGAALRGPLCEAPSRDERVRCLITARYQGDDVARDLALDLFARTHDVAGVEREQTMNGGYRGMLHLVPVVPIGKERAHLERVAAAMLDYQRFFAALGANDAGAPPHYRVTSLALRFFRSVKARTPSAYAVNWTVAYNVAGSLNGDADAVRETLFHEIFHLNDQDHGTEAADWSDAALGPIYDKLVARCGASVACLTPYAPNGTMVRGGTYYAFQPGNDVREYAAELAIRYYKEQRGVLGHGPRVAKPFKCGPPENRAAWTALVNEFFAGIDRVPACP